MDPNFNLSSFFLESEGGTKLQGVKTRVVSLNNEQKLKGNKSLVTPKVVEKSCMMVSQRKSAMMIIFSQKPNYMYCSGQLLNTLYDEISKFLFTPNIVCKS